MSSASALENALGIKITPQARALRRLMYCGEYIESHALHIYMLQAPDLFGKESAFELAAIAPDVVKNALKLNYLSDLKARALIVWSKMDSPAREVAQKHNIPIIELTPALEAGDEAGHPAAPEGRRLAGRAAEPVRVG